MLQLKLKSSDICRISKLLAKYSIKASISNSAITLNGDISDELLTQIYNEFGINTIQNFINKEPIQTQVVETTKQLDDKPAIPSNTCKYDLIYSQVKRGEMYWCDLGEPYGSEQGGIRLAIVVQNDEGNLYSPTTIVIPCTAKPKKPLPVHLKSRFSYENVLDYDSVRVPLDENVIMAEQIRTVDKTRLRTYIGTLTPEFMNLVDKKTNISLYLKEKVKVINKPIYVDRPILVNSEAPKESNESKDLNIVQIQLLAFVNITELMKISQSHLADDIKAQKILELFGFDFKKNGIGYLLKAIVLSAKEAHFNIESLSESVSKTEGIDKEEVKRLIIARVKERFGLRKAPTIDFIRLVNIILAKQMEI